MTAAMPARNKDWMAKSRILVSNIRCAIMSNCTTSISAAISVMSCEPRSVEVEPIKSLKQECGQQRQRGQHEGGAQQVWHAEQAQFSIRRFNHDDRGREQKKFDEVSNHSKTQRGGRSIRGDTEGKENIGQQCH